MSSLRTPLHTQRSGVAANALSCDLAFNLEGSPREALLGVAQLIELTRLLADRVFTVSGQASP
ncbi:DUF6124 family protein [Pseudomonas fildesensis]|uniref:DUF6124 family protein n=1 Tax=Pseudomonas fildesensis TaxID=1674920 RepID=UPI0009E5E10F